MLWFRKRKKAETQPVLSEHDREVLARELQESAAKAMSSNMVDALQLDDAGPSRNAVLRSKDIQARYGSPAYLSSSEASAKSTTGNQRD